VKSSRFVSVFAPVYKLERICCTSRGFPAVSFTVIELQRCLIYYFVPFSRGIARVFPDSKVYESHSIECPL